MFIMCCLQYISITGTEQLFLQIETWTLLHICYYYFLVVFDNFVVDCDKADSEKDVNTQEAAKDGEDGVEPHPRALHKTQSIFLRSLPALITRQEIEEVDLFIFYFVNISVVTFDQHNLE